MVTGHGANSVNGCEVGVEDVNVHTANGIEVVLANILAPPILL